MRIGGDPRVSDIMTEVGDGLRGVGPGRILPYLSQMGRDLALGQGVTAAVGVELVVVGEVIEVVGGGFAMLPCVLGVIAAGEWQLSWSLLSLGVGALLSEGWGWFVLFWWRLRNLPNLSQMGRGLEMWLSELVGGEVTSVVDEGVAGDVVGVGVGGCSPHSCCHLKWLMGGGEGVGGRACWCHSVDLVLGGGSGEIKEGRVVSAGPLEVGMVEGVVIEVVEGVVAVVVVESMLMVVVS